MTDVILYLFFPFPLCVFALTAAAILFTIRRSRKLAVALTMVAVLITLVCSTSPLPTFLVHRLERQYSNPWERPGFEAGTRDVRYIAVLGGSVVDNPRLPVTSRLNDAPLVRAIEAARIHRLLPESKIITSGRGGQRTSEASMMSQFLTSIGVEPDNLVIEDQSRNTHEQALAIRRIVGDRQFVLVTSAIHMPRAVLLFSREGMQPIAAPTGHLVKRGLGWNLGTLVPTLRYFQLFEHGLYEYLALAKAGYWI